MDLVVEKQFSKQLKRCPNNIRSKFESLYTKIENANRLDDIPNLKKIVGYDNFYRIRLGDWRVGFRYADGVIKIIHLMAIGPRGDFFNKFPPN
jgi:mRNA interferase RelE/StbE